MYVREAIKQKLEDLTGVARPSARKVKSRINRRKTERHRLKDDGLIPNNPKLPLIVYRNAARLAGLSDPAALFEEMFATNGWGDAWRNGIYDFVHYHPRTHEVLGIARGRAEVRFGGENGKVLRLRRGDVVVLPAGTGHQALRASDGLVVVGAYPPSGKYDEFKGSKKEHARARRMVPKVPLPEKDPVYGDGGAVSRAWRGTHARKKR
ncbi:MAG TPA: cupin domain-containing protein [Pseudolabrys sp.]|nr:cupin domain-containing protein [Pseudolabrys sp.]